MYVEEIYLEGLSHILEEFMTTIQKRTFLSFTDFIQRFGQIFKGPTFLMTFIKVDNRLREKILLTVSIANNCYT